MEEVWDTVPFAPFYEASTHGRVRSIARKRVLFVRGKPQSRSISSRILKPGVMSRGYLVVDLVVGHDQAKTFSVHRVIAITFLGENPDKSQVNHKNGVRTDNRIENLEWMTPSENVCHGYSSNGRISPTKGKFGKDHGASIPIKAVSIQDGSEIFFDSSATAGRSGFCASSICACLNGRRKTYKQMTWHKAKTKEEDQ